MNDIYRPAFHFTPPSMWMNDPNGMVYFDGEYHLFYQYHPQSDVWGPMHWGHAVSTDMINWRYLPIALHPDDNGMIFSGSAVVDKENTAGFGKNTLVAIFTYNRDYKESQNLAYSTDRGRTWTKYAGNPVIPPPNPLRDFRDPKVFRYEDQWVLALAAGNSIEFFVSSNLKDWTQSGSFGGGEYGSKLGVWETPDIFLLPVHGSDPRWVLTMGVGSGGPAGGSGTQYFIGHFDGRTFTSENPKETILWADHGADYYAPQSWSSEPNGRRIMLGWMSNWQYAREVPSAGQRGSMSIPRELTLVQTAQGIRLAHNPVREFHMLRGELHHWQLETIREGCSLLKQFRAECFEINAEFRISAETSRLGFHLRAGSGERTTLRYDAASQMLQLDRSQSGRTDFHPDFAAVHGVSLRPLNGVIHLQVIVDTCSVEVFANEGIAVMTDSIFPSDQSTCLEIFAEGGPVHLRSLDIYHLNPAIFLDQFIPLQTEGTQNP